MEQDRHQPPRDPRTCGSAEALAILLQLSRAPEGLQSNRLQALTGLDSYTTARALQGLKTRGMVIPAGDSTRTTTWRLRPHRAADQPQQAA